MSPRTRLTVDASTLISWLPLFAGLKQEHLRQLGTACRVIELPGHRSLFNIGQPIRELHYLISGSVKRFAVRSDNVEKVLELVQPGQLFALSEALVGEHYASCAETLDPSVVLAISVDTLRKIAAEDLTLASRLLDVLARQHYTNEFDVIRHRSQSATQRVLDYLLSLAGDRRNLAGETTVRLAANKRVIAARLDMAPESFSRTLRQLSDDGVIVVEGRTLHIQNATLAIDARGASTSPLLPVHYPRQERGVEPETPSPAELINLFGRSRMLSQRLATSWILLNRGIAKQASRVALRKFHDEFQRNLARSNELRLPEPLQLIRQALNEAWPGFFELLGREAPNDKDIDAVFSVSETILKLADDLTAAFVAISAVDGNVLVNQAGRNRMLCARIAKLFLFANWSVRTGESERLIRESIKEFDSNLAHLLQHSAGSPEAQAQLSIDYNLWRQFLSDLETPSAGNKGSDHARAVFAATEELLRHLDTTVKLFERLGAQQGSG